MATVTEVFVKWPSGPGPVCILLGEPTAAGKRGRLRRAPSDGRRGAHTAGRRRSPTPPPSDGFARSTATFRRSRGIALYGHKTNSTTRLAETRHKPATAAERIPNGISSRRRPVRDVTNSGLRRRHHPPSRALVRSLPAVAAAWRGDAVTCRLDAIVVLQRGGAASSFRTLCMRVTRLIKRRRPNRLWPIYRRSRPFECIIVICILILRIYFFSASEILEPRADVVNASTCRVCRKNDD